MNARRLLALPPREVGNFLFRDALVLWLGARAFALLFPDPTESPWLPALRTSLVIVGVSVLLCLLQVRRRGETILLRNLGVGRARQALLSAAIVVTLEIAARWVVGALLASGPVS